MTSTVGCPHCGARVNKAHRFCTACGKRLDDKQASPPPSSPSPTQLAIEKELRSRISAGKIGRGTDAEQLQEEMLLVFWQAEELTRLLRQGERDFAGIFLAGATLTGDLNGINMRGATLTFATLEGVNLYRANLKGALMSGTNLIRANLSYADLSGASLIGARLNHANLEGADLGGAELAMANLRGANLKGAVMPDGNTKGLFTNLRRFTDPLYGR